MENPTFEGWTAGEGYPINRTETSGPQGAENAKLERRLR